MKMRFPPQTLISGDCSTALKDEVTGQRILVIGSPRSTGIIDWTTVFPGKEIELFNGSRPHSPEAVFHDAAALARQFAPDTLIAIGSGSAIDLGKAVMDAVDATFIAIPTSLGGSEMTRIYGLRTADGEKHGKGGSRYLPRTVIYDSKLLRSIPKHELAASGINSWAHCIEAYYGLIPHWVGKAAAAQGGRMWPALLLASQQDTADAALYERVFEASSLAGFAINCCGLGIHHAACHVIGGATGITHGIVNAIVLPKALAINREIAPQAIRSVEEAFLIDDLVGFSSDIINNLNLPNSLIELGVSQNLILELAEKMMHAHHLKNNPAPINQSQTERLMESVFTGELPN